MRALVGEREIFAFDVEDADLAAGHPAAVALGREVDQRHHVLANLDELATYWLLDPLDGTANFVEGNPDFGTMLALVHDGEPVTSVAWSRMKKTTCCGSPSSSIA